MSNKLNGLSKTGAMLLKRALEFYTNNQDQERLDPDIKTQETYLLSQLESIIKHHEDVEANWYGPGLPLNGDIKVFRTTNEAWAFQGANPGWESPLESVAGGWQIRRLSYPGGKL